MKQKSIKLLASNRRIKRIVLLALLVFSMLLASERTEAAIEIAISPDDPQAQAWNDSIDARIAQCRAELESIVNTMPKQLLPHIWVKFDENQADWENYFRDGSAAFQYADFWSRTNPSAPYENLYREGRLLALQFRLEDVQSLSKKKPDFFNVQGSQYAIQQGDTEEAKYRIINWTQEYYRHRINRTWDSWDRYCDSFRVLVQMLHPGDEKCAASLEQRLSREMHDITATQREALFRIKYESEDP